MKTTQIAEKRRGSSFSKLSWAASITGVTALLACSSSASSTGSTPEGADGAESSNPEGELTTREMNFDGDHGSEGHHPRPTHHHPCDAGTPKDSGAEDAGVTCGDGDSGLPGIQAPAGTIATASGSYGSGTASNVIDGQLSPGWNAGDYTGWVKLTFPSRTTLDGFVINAGSEPNTPETYTITGYQGATAIALGAFTEQVDGTLTLPPMYVTPGGYDSVRFDIQGNASWVAVNEISLLTSACGAPDGGAGNDAGADSGVNDAGNIDAGSDSGSSGADAGAPWVVVYCFTSSATPAATWIDSDGSYHEEGNVVFGQVSQAGTTDTHYTSGSLNTPLTPSELSALLAAAQSVDTSGDGYSTTTGSTTKMMSSTVTLDAAGSMGESALVASYTRGTGTGTYTMVESKDPNAATIWAYCPALFNQ